MIPSQVPSLSADLWRLTAGELAALVARGEVTSVEVVEAHLERIDAVNDAVNAVTTRLDEEALAAAAARDRERSAGADLGPLHGVPVTVKESIDLAGSPTTMGNPSRAASLPAETGPEADGLLAAGAVVIGRTNAPDFSLRLHTDNDLHGPTRNPWDATRTPGGSGGGEAVAVATGMSALGLGGDVGGSLRVPAHWCGLTTLKPTPGLVPTATSIEPREPTLALALMTSYGTLARSVDDARTGFRTLARRDARDPWAIPPGARATECKTAFAVLDAPDVDPAIRAALAAAAEQLADAGYVAAEVAPPPVERAAKVWASLFLGDVAFLWPALGPVLSDGARRWLEDARTAHPPPETRDDLLRLYQERHAIAAAWSAFQDAVPLVLAPPMTMPAPPVGFDLQGPDSIEALFFSQRFVVLANVLGLPAAVVPVGVEEGLPVAVQIIGPRFGEELCLEAAAVLERPLTPIDPR